MLEPGMRDHRRAGTEGMARPADLDIPLALEAEEDLDLPVMAVLLDEAAGRNDLDAHRDLAGAAIGGTRLDGDVAVRRPRPPERDALLLLEDRRQRIAELLCHDTPPVTV